MMKLTCAFLVLVWGTLAHAAPLTAIRATALPEAIDGLTAAAQNNGYELVKVQPIDLALIKRGYPDPGVRILFIGNSSTMEQAMKANPKLLSVLPLRLTLIVEDKEITVSSDDLEIWKEMFPDPETARLIESWQRDLKIILGDFSGR
jgi:uncharacterized protein (DUF302 family)